MYEAYETVREDAIKTAHIGVPIHLRNAVTKLDSELGFGEGYQYAHNEKNKITNMICLPQELKDKKYYKPSMIGKEKAIKEELDRINKLKEEMNKK